jgi:hypothetical protein
MICSSENLPLRIIRLQERPSTTSLALPVRRHPRWPSKSVRIRAPHAHGGFPAHHSHRPVYSPTTGLPYTLSMSATNAPPGFHFLA